MYKNKLRLSIVWAKKFSHRSYRTILKAQKWNVSSFRHIIFTKIAKKSARFTTCRPTKKQKHQMKLFTKTRFTTCTTC